MEDEGTVQEFLCDWLGEDVGKGGFEAQGVLSRAFSHFPFHLNSLYYGPQNYGPMAPFFLKNTGYRASMLGYPYDDMKSWSGIYPPEIYENEYRQLCEEWKQGLKLLERYEGYDKELDEMIFMAKTVLCQYESAYHHARFVNRRNAIFRDRDTTGLEKQDYNMRREELLQIIREEMETVQSTIRLRLADSRVGFESSNHYFYTLQDLKEKMINLAYCEEQFLQIGGEL